MKTKSVKQHLYMFDALNVLTLHHTNDRHDVHIPQCITHMPTRYKQHISPISVQLQTIQNPLHTQDHCLSSFPSSSFTARLLFLRGWVFAFFILTAGVSVRIALITIFFVLATVFCGGALGKGLTTTGINSGMKEPRWTADEPW